MALSRHQFMNLLHLKIRLQKSLLKRVGIDRIVLLRSIERLEKRLKYCDEYDSYQHSANTTLRKAG